MALTELQARVLSALVALPPLGLRTVRELADEMQLTQVSVRAVLHQLSAEGCVSATAARPAEYWPTQHGAAVIKSPKYREYLPPESRVS